MAKKTKTTGGKSGKKGGKSRWDWLFLGALVVVIGFGFILLIQQSTPGGMIPTAR